MANHTRRLDSFDEDASASKRLRTSFSSSNAAKVFADSEEKMELIRYKGQVKMLETKISALERGLNEKDALSDKERQHQELSKHKSDARISTLERELAYIIDRERQALVRASKAEKLLFDEREKAEAKVRKINEERRLAEQEIADECDRLRTENQQLHTSYMEERHQATQLRHDCAQLRLEISALKRQHDELCEDLKESKDQVFSLRTTNQQLQDDITRFREECSVAMAMRDELLTLKSLQQENAVLKKQVERYKNTSGNTFLLKEQNTALEEQVQRLQQIQQQLVDENNELKAAISKSAETSGQHVSLAGLDDLSRHCIDLKNENTALDQEIQRLNGELEQKVSLIGQYETAMQEQAAEMEATLAEKDETIQSVEQRCAELEADIEGKDTAIEALQAAVDQVCTELKRVEHENLDLKKSLSPDVAIAECQTEGAVEPGSVDEYKKALEEKNARIDYLETRYGLKLDYDPATTHVIHMDDNPLSAARKEQTNRVEAVEAENHRLRVRLEELERLRQRAASQPDEPMNEDVTSKVDMRLGVEQLDAERKALLEKLHKVEEENQKQKERMKEAHQNLAREFREVCALLTGFQLKMKEGGLYVVQSIYEKGRENYFLVQKGEGNEINLLQNEYTPRWMDFVDTYLMTDHSIPAFLAAVTLSLYEKEKESASRISFGAASSSSSSS